MPSQSREPLQVYRPRHVEILGAQRFQESDDLVDHAATSLADLCFVTSRPSTGSYSTVCRFAQTLALARASTHVSKEFRLMKSGSSGLEVPMAKMRPRITAK